MSKASAENFELGENQGTHYQSVDHNLVEAFPKIYIFSIDPELHIVAKGAYGDFIIPACADGQEVSEPLELPGRYPSHMHMGTEVSPVHYEDGMLLARDIVGIDSQDKGLGRHTSNLEWHGVFISNRPDPGKTQIAAARAKRRQYLETVVLDADKKHMQGQAALIDGKERAAAQELRLKKIWAERPTAMDNCPACGSSVMPGVAVCAHCNAVLDEDKAKKFFPERFAKPEPKVAAKV
jgi:hypothetical protein